MHVRVFGVGVVRGESGLGEESAQGEGGVTVESFDVTTDEGPGREHVEGVDES